MRDNNLKKLRISIGKTQRDIAKSIGITTSYYGMIENNVRIPNLVIAKLLADYFNKKIEDIFFANRDNI